MGVSKDPVLADEDQLIDTRKLQKLRRAQHARFSPFYPKWSSVFHLSIDPIPQNITRQLRIEVFFDVIKVKDTL